MSMDVRKVKKLIEMLEQSAIAEIEVREGEESVRISRYPPPSATVAPARQEDPPAPSVVTETGNDVPGDSYDGSGTTVKSPMVGIFYTSPNPESEPYVTVGKQVEKGDVLCIIEAMKVMNHIEAPVSGVIEAVHVNNGEPVEFGELLFIIG